MGRFFKWLFTFFDKNSFTSKKRMHRDDYAEMIREKAGK